MVGVIIIAVVFTALAVGIAYGASKGSFKGVGAALQTTSRSGSRLLNTSLFVVYVTLGICVPLLFIFGNRDKSNAQVHGLKLTASMQVGRELFAEHCGVCHTLAATNSVGKTGPNLDWLKPPKVIVALTIKNGCLQKPLAKDASQANQTCLGYGTMPADILQGRQAQDVAEFVGWVTTGKHA